MALQRVRKTVHETVSAPQAQCTDRAGGGSSRDTKLGPRLLGSSDESAGGLQAQFIDSVVDKVVDMPDGVQRQWTMDADSARNRGGSAVAGHWRDHRNSCLGAEPDPNGANDAENPNRFHSCNTVKGRSMFLLCRLSRLHGCQSCGRSWQTQKPIERSVITRRQVPTIQKIQKAVETLQMQFEDEGGRARCDA